VDLGAEVVAAPDPRDLELREVARVDLVERRVARAGRVGAPVAPFAVWVAVSRRLRGARPVHGESQGQGEGTDELRAGAGAAPPPPPCRPGGSPASTLPPGRGNFGITAGGGVPGGSVFAVHAHLPFGKLRGSKTLAAAAPPGAGASAA